MQADLLLDLLKGLLNLPDLVILAVVLICMVLGFRRGFFGSLYGLVGKLIALAAAFFAAAMALGSFSGLDRLMVMSISP